jgi:phosphopantetheinyl transferase
MPVFFTDRFSGFQIGVWKISEDSNVLETGMKYRSIAINEERRLQQLAARKMLFHFAPELDLSRIEIEPSGKPIDKLNKLMFSLTHTKGYAAAIVGEGVHAGIDLEIISQRASRVAPRFLNSKEIELIEQASSQNIQGIHTLCWSIKETVYKWWGRGGIDFASHINIKNLAINGYAEVDCLFNGIERTQFVKTHQLNDFWLTYMTGMH